MPEFQNAGDEEYQDPTFSPVSSGTQREEFLLQEFQKERVKRFREKRHFCFYTVILLLLIGVLFSGFYVILKSQKNTTSDNLQESFKALEEDNEVIVNYLKMQLDILKNKDTMGDVTKSLKEVKDNIVVIHNLTQEQRNDNKDTVKDIWKELRDLKAIYEHTNKNCIPGSQVKYKVSTDEQDWMQSFLNCKISGMELISISTLTEHQNLNNFMTQNGYNKEYWIAGTNLGSNSFYWLSTGKPITYSSWRPGEPNNVKYPLNNHEGEHCVQYLSTGWNDRWCSFKCQYICQETCK